MNIWTAKSIKLAKRPGYLDKLQAIYSIGVDSGSPVFYISIPSHCGRIQRPLKGFGRGFPLWDRRK